MLQSKNISTKLQSLWLATPPLKIALFKHAEHLICFGHMHSVFIRRNKTRYQPDVQKRHTRRMDNRPTFYSQS